MRKPCLILSAVLLVIAAVTPVVFAGGSSSPYAAERLDAWTVIGPGGGGTMYIPTVSPHDTSRVLTRCDMTGAYISNDSGESWRMFNIYGVVRFFVFDPVDPDIIYARASGLFRSEDGGVTWKLVYPDPASITRIIMPDDHAGAEFLTNDGRAGAMAALAVDPDDSKKLYAAISSGDETIFSVSSDFGKTWTSGEKLSSARSILVDPKSPADNRTVYVITANSVSVFADGKWNHQAGPEGVEAFSGASGGFDSESGKPVFYGTFSSWRRGGGGASGLFVSRDGGATWENTIAALSSGAAQATRAGAGAVAASLLNGEVAYVTASLRPADGERLQGVAKTTDAGRTWEFLEEESYKDNEWPELPWYYPLYHGGWRVAPREMGVAPTNPDVVYGTDTGRTMRSVDGGRNWFDCFFANTGEKEVTTRGLDVTTSYGYHFDPFNPKRHFISYTDIGLFRSEDGGENWIISTENVPRAWRNTTYWIEFDPDVEGLVWGVFARNHDLPRPKMWRGSGVSRYQGGVAVSTDGARTWERSTEGMPETAATHVLLDPASPAGNRTLYVCGFGTGVWKSTDNGKTWALKNSGLDGDEPFAWRIVRDKNGLLYLIVARRALDPESHAFNTPLDGALYRSRDDAETWEKVPLPEGVTGPNGLAIDPQDPNRLYLACWGRNTDDGAKDGGILLSADAGKSWRVSLDRDQHIYDVTIDPRDRELLYACGFEHNAWRSEDAGATWRRIKGYNFKWGHRVVPDPANPDMVYITTFGGSIWYGPANGDPDAVEDVVTPEIAYSRK